MRGPDTCQDGSPWVPWLGTLIQLIYIIWCLVGVSAGWVAGGLAGDGSMTSRIEAMAVGVFGAFIGGDVVASLVAGPKALPAGLTAATGLMAVGGAIAALLALRLMRRAVGPMKSGKKRERNR